MIPKYRIIVVETQPDETSKYNTEVELLNYKTDILDIPRLVEFLGQTSDKGGKNA